MIASSSGNSGNGGGLFVLFVPVLLIAAAVMWSRIRIGRRRRRDTATQEDSSDVNPALLRGELSVLADDVMRLEPQVVLRAEARSDFDAATQRYRVAQAALDYTDAPIDLVRVQRVVDEATWSMARVRAILEGRQPPAPPSTLQNPGMSGEPAVELDGRERPVYAGTEAPFRTGWFAGGGGLFGGLLLGSVVTDLDWSDDGDDSEETSYG